MCWFWMRQTTSRWRRRDRCPQTLRAGVTIQSNSDPPKPQKQFALRYSASHATPRVQSLATFGSTPWPYRKNDQTTKRGSARNTSLFANTGIVLTNSGSQPARPALYISLVRPKLNQQVLSSPHVGQDLNSLYSPCGPTRHRSACRHRHPLSNFI